ncbi:hypothetical protein AVEN_51846-1 [Araneus ventricosus]|uniref:Uncharacterized protein n=1 Tax=Araneus ventricosus TaxID=182803 RepID=A0A4Y2TIT8_ARAVE|nr:hypothetical protein AVEN_51846-1 [Araneus ventricosus]
MEEEFWGLSPPLSPEEKPHLCFQQRHHGIFQQRIKPAQDQLESCRKFINDLVIFSEKILESNLFRFQLGRKKSGLKEFSRFVLRATTIVLRPYIQFISEKKPATECVLRVKTGIWQNDTSFVLGLIGGWVR